jgi:hypothetical protein
MPINYANLDYKTAKSYLPRPILIRADFEGQVLELIESGDFWQNAQRYCGPMPEPGDDYASAMAMLKKSFTPILKVRECVRRLVRGVIGREPQFEVVLEGIDNRKKERRKRQNYEQSRSDLELLADTADDVQGDVWDERGEHKIAKKAVQRLASIGRAYIRYDIPPGLLETGTDPRTGEETTGVAVETWEEAYRLTHMELCPRGTAFVHTDSSTQEKTAFYSYTETDPDNEKKTRNCVQVSWLEQYEYFETEGQPTRREKLPSPITQVRIFRDKGEPDSWEMDTGGILLVVEAETEPLITPDLLQLQDIACAMGTMVKINCDVAGFPQEDSIDIDRPLEEVPDPANPSKTKLVETTLPSGPRTRRVNMSYTEVDDKGNMVLDKDDRPIVRQGRLQYREPVSSEPLRDDLSMVNREIYSALNQRHIEARVSADASGNMLVELRADYADSLLELKPDVEKLFRNVQRGRLCMAAYLATGDEAAAALEEFKKGRVRFDLNLNAGPLSAEERADIIARLDKGLLSRETAMVMLGDGMDVEAELDKIRDEGLEEFGDRNIPVGTIQDAEEEDLAA